MICIEFKQTLQGGWSFAMEDLISPNKISSSIVHYCTSDPFNFSDVEHHCFQQIVNFLLFDIVYTCNSIHIYVFFIVVQVPEYATDYTLLKPNIYHGRSKKEITTTIKSFWHHPDHLTVVLPINKHRIVLDLIQNTQFTPQGYFRKFQSDGKYEVTNPFSKETKMCHYTGKIRNKPNSWVALSTCDGLSGAISNGTNIYYIEKKNNGLDNEHFLYKSKDLIFNNRTYNMNNNNYNKNHNFRFKRGAHQNNSITREPYDSDSESRYIELVLVVDNQKYVKLNRSLENVEQYCISISNILNGIYSSLNIFIVLTGIVVWNEQDEIEFHNESLSTLEEFLRYRRREMISEHPHDNAQLITQRTFADGISVGFNHRICTTEFSGGINTDKSPIINHLSIATTLAHTIGHNLGMEHSQCSQCIMFPLPEEPPPSQWSNSSQTAMNQALSNGLHHCLKNIPKFLYKNPICGNGFTEDGEECDCGLLEYCKNKCCNASTCKLNVDAKCATGKCCDLKTCTLKKAGVTCRHAASECDLPESCTGKTELCPHDVFRLDGEFCDDGKGHCYQGHCGSFSNQCKLLWGPTSKPANNECYTLNLEGNKNGNCGYNRLTETFSKCKRRNMMCGNLFCSVESESLRYGLKAVSLLSNSSVTSNGTVTHCKNVLIDTGPQNSDPGLVPNGASCARGKICVDQKCVSLADVQRNRTCPNNCYNNGYCNNLGHCHCDAGYLLPDCQTLSPGGSVDSGPIHGYSDIFTLL